ncbi:GNAT family N-acetyltransferase [Hahella sp. KA22]|uniref:GNAT family N-acetyltransferase n=1 Tax=Hahella sp. KA22 TaxID=1628392 RepID=UPI000FDCF6D3|nr:GNAT family N-acetyltransferase [Hahella sp. KA22]AZZ93842.1 GNAT family N-acetyltransferase [Hahella sp. KA22]QAY57215.1 GNAT family N-acetyltransferase [Hahella sp. KA22]
MINWTRRAFNELTLDELYALLRLRSEVFVVEQNCPYLDADGADKDCLHLLGWSDIEGVETLTAYLRLAPPGIKYSETSLGRIVTAPSARGGGSGKKLMSEGLNWARELYPQHDIKIQAQAYLEKFYQSFGFVTISEQYDEDGIPHIDMLLTAK